MVLKKGPSVHPMVPRVSPCVPTRPTIAPTPLLQNLVSVTHVCNTFMNVLQRSFIGTQSYVLRMKMVTHITKYSFCNTFLLHIHQCVTNKSCTNTKLCLTNEGCNAYTSFVILCLIIVIQNYCYNYTVLDTKWSTMIPPLYPLCY
jgi:hypothetical protein